MPNTKNRGFASMDAEKQRQIASKGGKAAHLKGTAHEFTSEEARIAGSKGGRAARQKSAKKKADLRAVQNPQLEESTELPMESERETEASHGGMTDPRFLNRDREIENDGGMKGTGTA